MEVMASTDQRVGVWSIVYRSDESADSSSVARSVEAGSIDRLIDDDDGLLVVAVAVGFFGSHCGE